MGGADPWAHLRFLQGIRKSWRGEKLEVTGEPAWQRRWGESPREPREPTIIFGRKPGEKPSNGKFAR